MGKLQARWRKNLFQLSLSAVELIVSVFIWMGARLAFAACVMWLFPFSMLGRLLLIIGSILDFTSVARVPLSHRRLTGAHRGRSPSTAKVTSRCAERR
jgi:hypothetical protein